MPSPPIYTPRSRRSIPPKNLAPPPLGCPVSSSASRRFRRREAHRTAYSGHPGPSLLLPSFSFVFAHVFDTAVHLFSQRIDASVRNRRRRPPRLLRRATPGGADHRDAVNRAITSASTSSPSWYDFPPPLSRRSRVRATPAMAPPRAEVFRRLAPPAPGL